MTGGGDSVKSRVATRDEFRAGPGLPVRSDPRTGTGPEDRVLLTYSVLCMYIVLSMIVDSTMYVHSTDPSQGIHTTSTTSHRPPLSDFQLSAAATKWHPAKKKTRNYVISINVTQR